MFKLIRFVVIDKHPFKLINSIRRTSSNINKYSGDHSNNNLDDKVNDRLSERSNSDFNDRSNDDPNEEVDRDLNGRSNDSNEEFGLTDHDVKNLDKKGSLLTEFREDISKQTLAESLLKYECSIKDALTLDTQLQKRIIIKVREFFNDFLVFISSILNRVLLSTEYLDRINLN